MVRLFLLMACLVCMTAGAGPTAAGTPERVSMIQLIADPGTYDGKLVNVVGFSRFRGERDVLYLGEADAAQQVYRNGVSLALVKHQDLKRKPKLDRHYVYVEGVFHANVNGAESLFSGSIDQISRLELWEN